MMLNIFYVFIDQLYICFGKMSIQILWLFKLNCLFIFQLEVLFKYSVYKFFVRYMINKYFLHYKDFLLTFLVVSSETQNFYFDQVLFIRITLTACFLVLYLRNNCLIQSRNYLHVWVFFGKSFIDFPFTFRNFIHFQLIFI